MNCIWSKNDLRTFSIKTPLWKFIQNENMATDNNKILKINGLILHFTNSYNTVKNIFDQIGSISTLTFHHIVLHLDVSLNCWSINGVTCQRHLKRICDKDNQYFFSAIAKGTFRKVQGFDKFFSGHWGNWIKLKSSSNAAGLNKLPVSTRLKISNSCDFPPIASSREREGRNGTGKGQH